MFVRDFLIVVSAFFLYTLFCNHVLVDRKIMSICNRSNQRKRKKGQNVLDWLFFRRFKDILPKVWYINNYVAFFLPFIVVIAFFALRGLGVSELYQRIPAGVYIIWWGITLEAEAVDCYKTRRTKKKNSNHNKTN